MAEWRPVLGFENQYLVSDDGRVESMRRLDSRGRRVNGKFLTPRVNTNGYVVVRLSIGNHQTVTYPLHRVILEAFTGIRPDGLQACHRDGDKSNNTFANLRWDTSAANGRDKVRHGTAARGERNGWAKLSKDQVENIWRSLEPARHIAERLGLHEETVARIRRQETWKWFTDSLPSQPIRGRKAWRPRKAVGLTYLASQEKG